MSVGSTKCRLHVSNISFGVLGGKRTYSGPFSHSCHPTLECMYIRSAFYRILCTLLTVFVSCRVHVFMSTRIKRTRRTVRMCVDWHSFLNGGLVATVIANILVLSCALMFKPGRSVLCDFRINLRICTSSVIYSATSEVLGHVPESSDNESMLRTWITIY